MIDIKQIIDKTKDPGRKKLLLKIHERIISIDDGIEYFIFPIYIRYIKGNSIIALLYYKNKDFIDLGLNINNTVINNKFENTNYMKYPGISFSIKVKSIKDIPSNVITYLKSL